MRRHRLASLVLLLVTFAVFSRVLIADFVQWDDDTSLYQNVHVQGLDWERLCWMFTDASYAMRYKPLGWLSYALIYQIGGLNPFGYHLANLMLHCVNAVLVFVVIRRLLAARGTPANSPSLETTTLPAVLGAAFWALNPLRVEPVAWVTDMSYGLSLSFLLISLWLYLRAHQDGKDGNLVVFNGWSVATYALAMLSYPFAVGWGIVLLALDWYPLRRFEICNFSWRDPNIRRILWEKLPFLLLGGMVLTTFLARMNPTGIWTGFEAGKALHFFAQMMQAFYIWAYYAWKPWVPFHLSPVYTTLLDFEPGTWPFWASASLVVGVSALVVWKRRQWPWALALWTCHLVLLLPVLGLTERRYYPSDRYDHIPGLVWAVIVAAALWRLRHRPKWFTAGTVGTAGLAAFLGCLSFHQARIWRNSETLFEHMITEMGANPYRADIHWRLGWFYATQGKNAKALQQYQTALRILPDARFYVARAELLNKLGNPEAALTNYMAVLQSSADPSIQDTVGTLLCRLGRKSEAIEHYHQALRLSPDFVPALNNLAWVLATDTNATNRNGAEAVQLAERARDLTSGQSSTVLGTLAAAYAETGRFQQAVAVVERARDQAQAAGESKRAERFQELGKLYQSGQPFHEPPSATNGLPKLPNQNQGA